MKKLTTTFVLAIFSCCLPCWIILLSTPGSLFAQPVPDAYGYIWRDNADSLGPAYNWIDITGIGTEITGLADDNVVGPFSFGFDFQYYWTTENTFYVGSNGYIALGNGNNIQISSGNPQAFPIIPNADINNNFVAPLLTDLTFTSAAGANPPAKAYYYTNNVDTLIVTFDSVAFYDGTVPVIEWSGNNTFQIIFAKTDSSITFQYKNQQGTYVNTYICPTPFNCDHRCDIGIENISGQIGLEVSNDNLPVGGTAIKFYYPDSVTISVPDVKPTWTGNPENAGFFEVVNRSTNISTNVANVGNVDINTSFNANIEIKRSNFTIAYSDVVSIPSLAQANNTTIVYPTVYTPDLADRYTITTSTDLSGDINPPNDMIQTEMVAVDTAGQAQVTLSFDDGISESSIGFQGGGIHFIPPFYPVDINEIHIYITGMLPYNDGFIGNIYDDDGPGGSQGTLLFSDTVDKVSVLQNVFNVITLPVPVSIIDGGFYVSCMINLDSTTARIGTDATPPFSFRNYEIIGGVWSEYRSNTAEDIMINAVISLPAPAPVPPIANFTQSANTICVGDTIQFSNTSVGADSIFWAFPGGTPGSDTAQSVDVTYPGAGVYTVTLFAYNAVGSDTITRTVNVDVVPVAGFTLNTDTIFTAYGDTLFTTDSSTGAISYLWDFDDGFISTAQEPFHIYTTGGNYSVILTVSNLCSTDKDTVDVFVCAPPVANFTSSGSGDSVSFTNLSPSATSYLWDFGDGSPPSSNPNPTHVYTVDSVYMVMLIVSDFCGPDTIIIPVNFVCTLPIANLIAPGSAFVGDSVLFKGNFSSNATSWLWDFGDGGSDSVDISTHVYTDTGTFDVILIVSNICGSDIDSITITITPPLGITPGSKYSFELGQNYPNPASKETSIHYSLNKTSDVTFTLSNILGKKVQKYIFSNIPAGKHQLVISTKDLHPGIYFYSMRIEGNVITKKMIITQ